MTVEIGQQAPDFELRNQFGEPVRLSGFRGVRNVVLVFYPYAFTPTCTGELSTLRDERASLEGEDTIVVGISCDPLPALKVFAETEGLDYSLLSDFWPHGAVSRAYGVFLPDKGFATRGTFVIDKTGLVRWSVVNAPGEARGTEGVHAAVAALRG
jgi:mycoredoxin-dependent peroxiredoxin